MAEASNAGYSVSQKLRARSAPGTGFPVVSLREATRIVRDAGKYGSSHSVAAFASYMGHASSTSGPFRQRLAAFRDWKLVERKGESVALTDLGMRIAHTDDLEASAPALRQAFFNAAPFKSLYDNSAKGVQLKIATLASQAVLNLHVAAPSKNKFISSFVESATFAGLAESSGDAVTLLAPRAADQLPSYDVDEPDESDQQVRDTDRPMPLEVVLNQRWVNPAVEVRLTVASRHTLPTDAFVPIGRAVAECETLFNLLVTRGESRDASE